MVQLYRETLVEAMILIVLIAGVFIFFPLFVNMYTVSLHILGPSWDRSVVVYGTSMEPTFADGDMLCVSETKASLVMASPVTGDVIVFQRPNSSLSQYPTVVAHRAIESATKDNLTYFRTKGDNTGNSDDWVDYRGENYTWNGMVSELLFMGTVTGIRREYAVVFPVTVMAVLVVGMIFVEMACSAVMIHKIGNQTRISG